MLEPVSHGADSYCAGGLASCGSADHIVLLMFHLTPWWLCCLTMLAFSKTELMTKLCDHKGICVQHLVVEHVDSRASLRIFNAHIPTSVATRAMKEAIAKKLCRTATSMHGSGVAQPTATQHTTAIPLGHSGGSERGCRHHHEMVSTVSQKQCAVPVYIWMASHARHTKIRYSIVA